jgi:hypothetical protein
MWAIVQNALAPKAGQATTSQRVQQIEDYSRPWAIVRLLPDLRRYTVARFLHRQDAEDHRRFLHRYMPASEFQVVFDVPNSRELMTKPDTQANRQTVNPGRNRSGR